MNPARGEALLRVAGITVTLRPSFAALVKDAGYFLIFPPTLRENLTGLAGIAAFVGLATGIKLWSRKNSRG